MLSQQDQSKGKLNVSLMWDNKFTSTAIKQKNWLNVKVKWYGQRLNSIFCFIKFAILLGDGQLGLIKVDL